VRFSAPLITFVLLLLPASSEVTGWQFALEG
jgi:hypothetical protein